MADGLPVAADGGNPVRRHPGGCQKGGDGIGEKFTHLPVDCTDLIDWVAFDVAGLAEAGYCGAEVIGDGLAVMRENIMAVFVQVNEYGIHRIQAGAGH
jgi:hypothetical protein